MKFARVVLQMEALVDDVVNGMRLYGKRHLTLYIKSLRADLDSGVTIMSENDINNLRDYILAKYNAACACAPNEVVKTRRLK